MNRAPPHLHLPRGEFLKLLELQRLAIDQSINSIPNLYLAIESGDLQDFAVA